MEYGQQERYMPEENFSQATDVGLVRQNNEDAVLSNPELGLWLVADGMGGHAAGEVASKITSEIIEASLECDYSLEDSIQNAHKAVLNAVDSGTGKYGMGSTVIALQSKGKHYQIGWVGDSRAYLYSNRPNPNTSPSVQASLQQLSTDHSYVQMLFQAGTITAEELESHPEKNIITQCLGSTDTEKVNVDTAEGTWKKGDWIILCSDGLTDIVTDKDICDILTNNTNIHAAVAELIKAALTNGGKDNVSVVIVAAPSTTQSYPKIVEASVELVAKTANKIKSLIGPK